MSKNNINKNETKILVVDDLENNLIAMEEALDSVGVNIITATSGKEALELVLQNEFAVILLDVQMPDMDGFETARLLKKNKLTAQVPIVFVTAYSKDQKHIIQGHQIGAVDYLLKPVDPIILNSKVSVYLEHYNQKKYSQKQLNDMDTAQKNLSKMNNELQYLAEKDALTGASSRLNFDKILPHIIQHAKTNNALFAVLFVDLDNFKYINDEYGHDIGDELLKLVSLRICESLRSSDYISLKNEEYTLSRLGGDEFAIILNKLVTPEDAGKVAERIIKSFREPYLVNGTELIIGLSIGIAIYPHAGETPELLCKHADQAMYIAKKNGKNSFHCFTLEMAQKLQNNVNLVEQIKQALQEDKFYLVYQPIYNLQNRSVAGIEALCRWNHQDLEKISPRKVINTIEKNELLNELSYGVLHKSIKTLAELQKQQPDIWLSMNISTRQLFNLNFITQLEKMLQLHHIPPNKIKFEVSESDIEAASNRHEKTMAKLNELGIEIIMCNFGSGRSSLKKLIDFPMLSTLKIDPSFIQDVGSTSNGGSLIIAILDLARNLKLTTIAEGVETEEQLRFLVNHDCQYGQGYCFLKPIEFDKLTKILIDKKKYR